jgi:hypothetical protein
MIDMFVDLGCRTQDSQLTVNAYVFAIDIDSIEDRMG